MYAGGHKLRRSFSYVYPSNFAKILNMLVQVEAPVQGRDRCYCSCRVLASVQRDSLTFQLTPAPLLQYPTHSIPGSVIATLDLLRVARDLQRNSRQPS
jgi:hypothetical protein